MLSLLLAAAVFFPVGSVLAQTETATPTITATPLGSVEEVYRLDSGNYVVVQHSFSYGELTVMVVMLILTGVILRINDRDKAA